MIAAGLLYLGLFTLAAAMPRHGPDLLGRWNAPPLAARLPVAGWMLLALSLAASLLTPDWPRALVAWFGLAPLAAGIVLPGLTFRAGLAQGAVLGAAALVVAGSLV
ncbi:DUF3325 domain-containing protein [Sphingomonas sp. JC676]|uniref:DUF3325 domain-containing protein n=1 Tax=Sphingomonas sp. JC676 TaxID=2768065 RepID=UPI00165816BC|nr:DUF3325 domain-containing protein [Sphingomonas sp. JC676]MBC9032202.1 DUF3325 domain-containing protein [Sphingomonas sp. JC676]